MHRVIIAFLCSVIVNVIIAERCITPNGEEAQCISLYDCPILLDALRTIEPESVQFVQKSQCGYDVHPLVCCGSNIQYEDSGTTDIRPPIVSPTLPPYTSTTSRPQPPKDPKLKLLPDRRYCGYQHFDDYFHIGNFLSTSSIDEFPWMVALMYRNTKNVIVYGCAGSLISNRYVLTAAHCLDGRGSDLVAVRLGEYNIQKDEDCIKNEQFEECTDPVADFGFEQIVVHLNWNRTTLEDDIGLIRLDKVVKYTDFVRPICLPFPGTKFAKIGDNLSVSGWGKTEYAERGTDIKKKVLVELAPLSECRSAFINPKIVITENHMCMRRTNNSAVFSCQGDSGSPVMFSNRNQWHQEGTVSFGTGCGREYPTVNVKVSNYLKWILDNIRK